MKRIRDFKVKEYKWFNNNNYLIELQSEDNIPEVKAGNFAEIKIPDANDVFLRRPFSILDVNHDLNSLTFYIKIAGKGTLKLGQLTQGQEVNLIYPLGNCFNTGNVQNALIIGGGSGIAPFLLLAKELSQNGSKITFLLGGRSKQDILLTKAFELFGNVLITTEDGSLGEKGLVTEHSVFNPGNFNFDKIYTCGPDPMMKAVARFAKEKQTDCEASLENMMGCGFGVCLCCVTETIEGNKCVCTEGPVFNTNDLKWQT